MEGIRQTAVAVCAVLILCSAIEIAVPSDKYRRAVSLVFGAVFLCTLLTGLSGITLSLDSRDLFDGREARVSSRIDSYAQEAFGYAAEGVIGAALAENGFVFDNIEVRTNISGDGGISIERVTLDLLSGDKKAAESLLGSMLGGEAPVVIEERR